MKKKYKFKSKIVQGDVLSLLKKIPKHLKFDVVIADPPYNIGKNFGNNTDNMKINEYVNWSKKWISVCFDVLSEDGLIYVYGFHEILARISVEFPIEEQRWLAWHYTNKIFLSALNNNFFKEFSKDSKIKSEVKFGDNTRFDFLISKKNYKAFIEVKNVTLSRKQGIAEFPDSVTSRGAKHINELVKASKKGYEIYIAYVIQREDCKKFLIASDIDPEYNALLSKAVKKKLNIICYDCKFSSKGIKLNNKIKFINK